MLCASLRNCYVTLLETIFLTVSFAMECPSGCTCDSYGKGIFCPENDPEVHIAFRNAEDFSSLGRKNVEIECFNPKSNNEGIIDYCSISTILNDVLLRSNIGDSTKLVFESATQNRTDIIISKDAFKSVPNLNILSISYNSVVTFERDFLRNTPNITALVLTQSGIPNIDGNYFTYISKLKYLRLSENKLSWLPNRAFGSLPVLAELYLDSNRISNLSQYAFRGLRKLQVLDLSRNQIQELTEDNFKDLNGLLHIKLGYNPLKNIHGDVFYNNPLVILEIVNTPMAGLPDHLLANLTALTTVNLELNQLEEIPENVLRKCENLGYLSLSKNQLARLPEALFKGLFALEMLDLSKNILKSLPNNLLASTTKLEILNLSNNQLSVINNYLFRKLNRLRQIDLYNNKIYLIESQTFRRQYQSLTYLDLSHNEWNASSTNSSLHNCQRLQELNLSHNNIRKFLYMPALTNLKKMDLSYNYIDHFEVKHIITLSPTDYDLSNNKIRNITFGLDKPIDSKRFGKAKKILNVSNNPLQCDCSIYDLVCYNNGEMDNLSGIIDIVQNNLSCPDKHHNMLLIKAFKPADVECSILEGCPSICKCSFTPYNKALVIDCAFKNLTKYPEIAVEKANHHQQIVVNLSGNLLTKGPFQQESYDKITTLNLSSNRIVEIDWIPSYTKELDLSNNSIKNLNSTFIRSLRNSTNLRWLGLSNNPWTCLCDASDFRDYLIENHDMVNLHEVYCENMDSPLVQITDLCKEFPYLPILLPTFLTIVLCLIVTLALYYRYQTELKVYLFSKNMCLWFVTEEEIIDKDRKFDVFISYSHQDEDFVLEQLLPQLEQDGNPFKVCIHIRDWIPGEFIAHQIIQSVQNSRRTLIVLSNSFLESVWGKMEFRAAHSKALAEGRARVIVLLYGDIEEKKLDDEMKSYLKTNTYIKWGENYFWDKLRYALPHLKKNVILRTESVVDMHDSIVLNAN